MLLKEFNDVLEAAETTINMRHLELLCDTMTYQGFTVSVSIHGVKKTDSGPLARASFEETTTELTRAAVFHEDDNMNGVSANIMFGQYLKAGTNDFGIVLDENMILNNDYEPEEEEEASYVEFVNVIEEEAYCNNEEFDLTFDF
jgi:DNA-directed RNA polymerase II subunit RPB1